MATRTLTDENPLYGGALSSHAPDTIKAGTILRVNPTDGSCDVYAEKCYYGNVAIPGMSADPAGGGGSADIPHIGQPVMIRCGSGWPTITQILPVSTNSEAADQPRFDLADEVEGSSGLFPAEEASFSGRTARGTRPGDWFRMGNQGQSFSLLEGGGARMKASPLAQVVASASKDMLRLVGHNLEMFTGFGETKFHADAGKRSFEFSGSTDQLQKNKQVQVLVGGNADGLADFRVLNQQGDRVYSYSVSPGGEVTAASRGAANIRFDGGCTTAYGLGRRVDISSGDDLIYLEQGQRVEHYAGGQTTEVMESKFSRVGGNRRDRVVNDWSMTSRNMDMSVSGDPLLAHPLTDALSYTVANGSVRFDVGNPIAGDLGKSLSGFKVNVNGVKGNIELGTSGLGAVFIDSLMPASVHIGATYPVIALEPAVLGNLFTIMIEAFELLYNTHTHIVPGPYPLAIPTSQQSSGSIKALALAALSKKVMIGY